MRGARSDCVAERRFGDPEQPAQGSNADGSANANMQLQKQRVIEAVLDDGQMVQAFYSTRLAPP